MTTQNSLSFVPEQWVVHRDHGVGRIVGVEEKGIGGNVSAYYRIETNDSLVFAPVSDAERLRPITPPEEFAEAMAILQRPAQLMDSAYIARLAQIRKADEEGTPAALARVLRDLWGRRQRRGQLSNAEDRAWRRLSKRFLAEWAASLGLEVTAAKEGLYTMLQQADPPVEPAPATS